jgi:hypothetical protein
MPGWGDPPQTAIMAVIEHRPGERALMSGVYEELNVFGTPTGKLMFMAAGDQIPAAPRGFLWRSLSEQSVAELRVLAARYRAMVATAATTEVMEALQSIATRIDAMIDQREAEGRE